MEGDAVLSSIDSLWFYSSVFLRPSSKHKEESECAEGPQLREKPDSAETKKTTSGRPCQAPKCVKEAAAQTGRRAEGGMVRIAAATARGCSREWDERMVAWHKEQRRRALVAEEARCSQATMPPPGEGASQVVGSRCGLLRQIRVLHSEPRESVIT